MVGIAKRLYPCRGIQNIPGKNDIFLDYTNLAGRNLTIMKSRFKRWYDAEFFKVLVFLMRDCLLHIIKALNTMCIFQSLLHTPRNNDLISDVLVNFSMVA